MQIYTVENKNFVINVEIKVLIETYYVIPQNNNYSGKTIIYKLDLYTARLQELSTLMQNLEDELCSPRQ